MKSADKINLYQLFKKTDYSEPKSPKLLQLKPAQYLAIDGEGFPGDDTFPAQIGALFAVAFTIKMKRKFAGKQDYVIGKPECLWLDAPAHYTQRKKPWHWSILIRTPDCIKKTDLAAAQKTILEKNKAPAAAHVRLLTLNEGDCLQILHTGPYENSAQSYAKLLAFAEASALKLTSPSHEIYLNDPRRIAPEKLKTILRIPVAKK